MSRQHQTWTSAAAATQKQKSRFAAPPVIQPKAKKKAQSQLPQSQPSKVSPLARLQETMAAQAKLSIGQPNDKYEQEADRVAHDVVQRLHSPIKNGAEPGPVINLKPLMQRSSALTGGEASSELESSINRAKGGGKALDSGLQQSMGSAMGADFSSVKVHTDSTADQLNKSVQARAFTTGSDVFFRKGEYSPGSKGGQELIAHELTHVVQQGGANNSDISSIQGQLIQRRLPPRSALEISMDITGNQTELWGSLHRLLYIEHQQGRLVKATDGNPYNNVDEALADIFPNDTFDSNAYDALYGVNEKYEQVLPSAQDLSNPDWERLAQVVVDAGQLAKSCSTRDLWIEEVFGPAADQTYISGVYKKAGARLSGFGQDNFTIDYNGDDAEMHVGGATSPGSGKIKLTPKTLTADDRSLSTVLLHEACHEVDAKVIDCGYYGTARFNKMSQKQKKKNAAHYEEIAMRIVGKSRYEGQTFIPEAMQKKTTNKGEFIKKERVASEGLRTLWSNSASLHDLLRDFVTGNKRGMTTDQVVNVTKAIKNAYSLGTAGNEEDAPVVTQLELALMESTVNVFARAMDHIKTFKKTKDKTERQRLLGMSVKDLGLEAVLQVGGFQGINNDIDENHINRIRFAMATAPINIGDPFPEFGEDN